MYGPLNVKFVKCTAYTVSSLVTGTLLLQLFKTPSYEP